MGAAFQNDDTVLLAAAEKVLADRRDAGLEGLVGGLAAVIINTAPQDLVPAATELIAATALRQAAAFTTDTASCLVLRDGFGADFLLQARQGGDNPFAPYNHGAKTPPLVPGRLETFVYACHDLGRYVGLQRRRGITFLTPAPLVTDTYAFIQTAPSVHTGNSLGFIEWKGRPGRFDHGATRPLDTVLPTPGQPWRAHVRGLDHVATRVRARQRDAAILEFLALTNYHFAFAVYVESLNSITNVARLADGEYAQVFTSGISPSDGGDPGQAGPTERFIQNYGLRPHHLAFAVEHIEEVVAGLDQIGLRFLSELVGSREEGLKQIFSAMSPRTYLVNEYIERYDGFDGFFTKSNVTRLTKATEKQ